MSGRDGRNYKKNENPFLSVAEYGCINIGEIIHLGMSEHAAEERMGRFKTAVRMNKDKGEQAPVVDVFLVDRGHKDGKELHCVTRKAVIYILNEHKYRERHYPVITALFARPNQVERLYKAVGRKPSPTVMHYSRKWQEIGANRWS